MTENKQDEQDMTPAPEQQQSQPPPPQMVSVSEIEWERINKELSEYKDKYLRLLAESENARKRLQKERHELTQYAVQNVIVDFLNPIDHMENALQFTQNMSDEVKNWAIGFQMISSQFKDVLSNNGVAAYKSVGTQFDPHMHEAVEMVETDQHAPGIVVEESIRGYRMGDRIIRPARVKVAKKKEAQSKQEQEGKPNGNPVEKL